MDMDNPPEELTGLAKRLDSLTVAFMQQEADFADIDQVLKTVEQEFLRKTSDHKWSNLIKSAVIDRKWYFALRTNQSIEFCESLFSQMVALGYFDKLQRSSRILIAARHWLAHGERAHAIRQLESLIPQLSPDDEWESLQLTAATELLTAARDSD